MRAVIQPIPVAIPPNNSPPSCTFIFSYFRALLEPSSDAIRLVLPAGPRSLCLDLALEGGLHELLLSEKRNPSAGSEVVRGHCEQRARVARVVGVSGPAGAGHFDEPGCRVPVSYVPKQ